MDRSTAAAARGGGPADRAARIAMRGLRLAADPRLALGLLLATGGFNVVAATSPAWRWLLDSAAYLVLLGALVLAGLAGVAVRAPALWREWRRPAPFPASVEAASAVLPLVGERPTSELPASLAAGLAAAGYRVSIGDGPRRWSVAGIRRGWARLAGLGSHVAVVLLVLGAAIGAAFSAETTFSLLPGDQALLDSARQGFTDAVRLDRFDPSFGADGRPRVLDTAVTFLRDSVEVERQVLQVNRPGSFGGYLVHAWTYGPAAQVRVSSLGGSVLLDAAMPLDGVIDGRPGRTIQLPTLGQTLAVTLVDADGNVLAVAVAGGSGLVDAARLAPGEAARVGDVEVRHQGLTSYVTFASRRDPGLLVLFGAAGLLVVALAIGFWVPWHRVSITPAADGVRLAVRSWSPDAAAPELARLARIVGGAPPAERTEP